MLIDCNQAYLPYFWMILVIAAVYRQDFQSNRHREWIVALKNLKDNINYTVTACYLGTCRTRYLDYCCVHIKRCVSLT